MLPSRCLEDFSRTPIWQKQCGHEGAFIVEVCVEVRRLQKLPQCRCVATTSRFGYYVVLVVLVVLVRLLLLLLLLLRWRKRRLLLRVHHIRLLLHRMGLPWPPHGRQAVRILLQAEIPIIGGAHHGADVVILVLILVLVGQRR